MLKQLWNDEAGFIVSAELILVATLLVIGLIVGMSEIQHAVVQELNDVGDAIGSVNQTYSYTGFSAAKSDKPDEAKSFTRGAVFVDKTDDCDGNQCDLDCDMAKGEDTKS